MAYKTPMDYSQHVGFSKLLMMATVALDLILEEMFDRYYKNAKHMRMLMYLRKYLERSIWAMESVACVEQTRRHDPPQPYRGTDLYDPPYYTKEEWEAINSEVKDFLVKLGILKS